MTGLPGLRDGRLADRRVLETGRLARALRALDGEGEETRLVGGAVRDLALGVRRAISISPRRPCRRP